MFTLIMAVIGIAKALTATNIKDIFLYSAMSGVVLAASGAATCTKLSGFGMVLLVGSIGLAFGLGGVIGIGAHLQQHD